MFFVRAIDEFERLSEVLVSPSGQIRNAEAAPHLEDPQRELRA
jgi:hypothetical protein